MWGLMSLAGAVRAAVGRRGLCELGGGGRAAGPGAGRGLVWMGLGTGFVKLERVRARGVAARAEGTLAGARGGVW